MECFSLLRCTGPVEFQVREIHTGGKLDLMNDKKNGEFSVN